MALQICFQGGQRAGQSLDFGDEVEQITFGRDAGQCDVVFPPGETLVGRQHCALRRELGRYRLVLNEENAVWLNGELAGDDQELPEECDLQLGKDGPLLVVRTTSNEALPSTKNYEDLPAGTTTEIRRSSAKSKRAVGFSLFAIVLIACLGGLTYAIWKQNQESADVQRQELEGVKIRLAKEINLNDRQREAMAQAEKKFAALDREISLTDHGMAKSLNAAEKSVYLVIIRDAYGNESTFATAWVVDQEKGILATNAHVGSYFDSLRDDESFVVRSTAEVPRSFTVQSVRIHPGYDDFNRVWREYDPTIRASLGHTESVRMPGPGCDVALMYVDRAEGLAPALQLADDQALHAIQLGDLVGSVGFPSEGLMLGGVNKESPTPISHMAYVIAMTDFFGVDDTAIENRLLIQHAIPTIGGSSGSPIIGRDGRVIAIHSGGNVIGQTASARIKSAAQINMAQRADLIKELLNNTAAQAQQARTRKWQEDIRRYYVKRKDADLDVSVDRRLGDWRRNLAEGGEYAVTITPVSSNEVPGDGKTHSSDVKLDQAGRYLAAAIGERKARIRLDVYEMQGEQRARRFLGVGFDDWLKSTTFELAKPGTIQIVVENTGDATPVKTRAFLAETKPYSAEQRGQRILKGYKRLFKDRNYTEVSHTTGNLRRAKENAAVASAEATLDLGSEGYYLVIAVADQIQDLDLTLTREKDGADVEIFRDRGPYSWAYGSFKLDEPTKVRVLIMGEKEGGKFHLQVYHATGRVN